MALRTSAGSTPGVEPSAPAAASATLAEEPAWLWRHRHQGAAFAVVAPLRKRSLGTTANAMGVAVRVAEAPAGRMQSRGRRRSLGTEADGPPGGPPRVYSRTNKLVYAGFGKCGQDDSWANRPQCRSCGGRQPITSLATCVAARKACVDGSVHRRGGIQTHFASNMRSGYGGRRQYGRRAEGGAGGSFCGAEGGGAGARCGGGAAVGGSGGEGEASAGQGASTIIVGSSQEGVGTRAETFKATNTQHKLQEQAKAMEQRLQESNAIAAQLEVELAAARAEALDFAELAELSREKKCRTRAARRILLTSCRAWSQRRSREQDSGGKSSAGAVVHVDAVIGGVGVAAIPGTAVPTGSAPTGASAGWAAAPPAALATANTVATQAVEATVQDAKKT